MYKKVSLGVCAPKGFLAAGLHCGIRKNKDKKDLSLIYSEKIATAASVYTKNKVKGAPILITKKHLKDGLAQAVLVNSGNANTCNQDGEEIAESMCELCSLELNIKKEDIIIASTGVIGQALPIEPIAKGMPQLVKALDKKGSRDAVEGIMTTDTYPKELAISFELDGKTCYIGGMAKGSGMIHPDMATMLSFITTDVAVTSQMLNKLIKEVADESFNMISVDGDTSTNDMFSIMANSMAGNTLIYEEDKNYQIFKEALMYLAKELARMLAADGEGAGKLLTCKVNQAKSLKDARVVAKSIISSSLLKCAMYGNDANWGRILCAIGYSKADVDVDLIDVSFASKSGFIKLCENGKGLRDLNYETGIDENKAKTILSEDEIEIIVDLKNGIYDATAWGCDLTYDYVKINGDYRS